MAIGHSDHTQSIYNNPQLYPQMFPWLFPYGLGGIGVSHLSDEKHKRHLLMYHDKCFQMDVNFPFVAFSHAQMKETTKQGFLLADKRKFQGIADHLLSLDQDVLLDLTTRLANGETVKPSTEQEKLCFQVMKDLDPVAGKVNATTSSKKYMHNEIWSLMAFRGAPSWYITLSPADIQHPICLYFAGKQEKFESKLMDYADHLQLISSNPVAVIRSVGIHS